MISDTCLHFSSFSNISPLIPSCFLSYQSLIIIFCYPRYPTLTHDFTPISIKRRHGSVLDHLSCVFIHISNFRFNIFHDGGLTDYWLISDDVFTLTVGMWSVDLFALCILSTDHYCCYSPISFVLSAWCHGTWSCLALPIWGWTFSLHDGWAYFKA